MLNLDGYTPDMEVLCPSTTGDLYWVPSRAILCLLVRSTEYTRGNGIQLHKMIWGPMDSTTLYNTTPTSRNLKTLLKLRIPLRLFQLRTRPPCSSAQSVPIPFQSCIFSTNISRNTIHHSHVTSVTKLSGTEKISLATISPSTQRQWSPKYYFVHPMAASSPLREVPVPHEETI